MGQVINIETKQELIDLTETKPNIILAFKAPWCGPCRQLTPLLDIIAGERDDVQIVSVNVDNSAELTTNFGIKSIPAMFFLKNGKSVGSTTGFIAKNVLINHIKNNFGQ
jgi:thioredoxin 1